MDLEIVCQFCKGTKKLDGQGPCPFCGGKGHQTNIVPTVKFYSSADIVERVVFSDWDDLSNKEQNYLNFLVSASYMDMDSGAMARETLRTYFPSGTATNAALSALIGEEL